MVHTMVHVLLDMMLYCGFCLFLASFMRSPTQIYVPFFCSALPSPPHADAKNNGIHALSRIDNADRTSSGSRLWI